MKKFLVFILLFACSKKDSDVVLAPQDFAAKYKTTENAVLVDVRTVAEVSKGALSNSRNIVYDDAFAGKLQDLPKDAVLFVYCASGKRSAKAARILREKGFEEVYELKGGMNAWQAESIPLTF